METVFTYLGAGAVTLFNGVWALITTLASPITLAVVVSAAGFFWLAGIEVEELNRQGTKPDVQLH
jgi:hypothetical protein